MAVRKDINSLTATEKQDFIKALKGLKANGVYDQFTKWHAQGSDKAAPMPGTTETASVRNAAHKGPAFEPWHREMLRRFELELQKIVPGIGLPYWNWSKDASLSNPTQAAIWRNDFMGPSGDASDGSYVVKSGPFAYGQWTVIYPSSSPVTYADGRFTGGLRRELGLAKRPDGSPLRLPSSSEVGAALNKTTYDVYRWSTQSNAHRNTLEGWLNGPQLHNCVHRWVGGSMMPNTSPNDPVFYLNHCNVDRLWAIWQSKYPNQKYQPETGGPVGHNLNDQMFPWNATPASVLNHTALGYSYV